MGKILTARAPLYLLVVEPLQTVGGADASWEGQAREALLHVLLLDVLGDFLVSFPPHSSAVAEAIPRACSLVGAAKIARRAKSRNHLHNPGPLQPRDTRYGRPDEEGHGRRAVLNPD